MNRVELQEMAEERVKDAQVLLDGGRWEFAYYAAGYAVECALKACLLARMIHTGLVFQEKWEPKACFTHNFGKLIDLAGMRDELNDKLATSSATAAGAFVAHWGTVIKWKSESRYHPKTETEAREHYKAITHDPDGVLPWIKTFW